MIKTKKEVNDYGYALGLDHQFIFKDPKALNTEVSVEEYKSRVVQQTKEDILRLYLCDSEVINKENIDTYIEKEYSVIGIKIIVLEDLLLPMFYRVTKRGAKRKNINERVQSFKTHIEDIDSIGEFGVVDYFIAWK